MKWNAFLHMCMYIKLMEPFVREFIETGLLNFAKENPGVVVYVKPRRHRTPVLVGEYRKYLIGDNIDMYITLKYLF